MIKEEEKKLEQLCHIFYEKKKDLFSRLKPSFYPIGKK